MHLGFRFFRLTKNLVDLKTSYLVLLLSLLAAYSCSTPKTPVEEVFSQPEAVVKTITSDIDADMPTYKFQFASLSLNQHMRDIDPIVFEHYGEFYTEDFSIYRLDRIDYLAESYFIDDINLYYIDSLLVKIQAYLREDRTDEFLRKYGKAKIYIHDYKNKKLLETEQIITKKEGKYRVNEKLDAYKLKWLRKDLDIEYSVSKKADTSTILKPQDIRHFDDKRQRYKLTFQTKDFDNQLAWVKWESYKQSKGLVAEPASDK